MPHVRAELKKSPHGLKKHEFLFVYHYSLQYESWKEELTAIKEKPPELQTKEDGQRAAWITERMQIIERICEEIAPTISDYLLKAVTTENSAFTDYEEDIPCDHKYYSKKKRQFYFELFKRLDKLI